MLTVTVMGLIDLLCQHYGATVFTFTAKTDCKNHRKNGMLEGLAVVNRYYKNTVKISTVNVMTDFNYAKRINKVRAADGLEGREIGINRAGMVHIDNVPLVISKGGHVCLWCEVRSVKKGSTTYQDATTGKEIDKSYFTPFTPAHTTEIAYCTYGLDTIQSITINGTTYNVDQSTYEEAQSQIVAYVEDLNPKTVTA